MLEKQWCLFDGCKLSCIAGRTGLELYFVFYPNVLCFVNAFHVCKPAYPGIMEKGGDIY